MVDAFASQKMQLTFTFTLRQPCHKLKLRLRQKKCQEKRNQNQRFAELKRELALEMLIRSQVVSASKRPE